MNKRNLSLILLILFLSFASCSNTSDDSFFSFRSSSDYIPKYHSSNNYTTEGRIHFGQYKSVGLSGEMDLNYKGLPKGEFIAYWHSFKYDRDKEYEIKHNKLKNVNLETFFYAYDPDITKIKIPSKRKNHLNYTAFLSYGRYALNHDVLKDMDLTDIPHRNTPSGMRLYQIGEIDKIYALILSERDDNTNLRYDHIYMTPPSEHYEIQAIEITEEQYKYFMKYVDKNVYLDDRVPGFTEKQKKYMDARKRVKK